MSNLKYIHAADLHLDTPFRGLSQWNQALAGQLKDATFKSFQKIVQLAIDNEVDFLLIAGDIFDSENRSIATQLRFIKELQRLSDQEIPTYFITGNHDPMNSWITDLTFPERVYRFPADQVTKITHYRGQTALADIYGISYGRRDERRNLARMYQVTDAHSPVSIALLHGTLGENGPHANYAPFSLDDVRQQPFDYWALGHIHKNAILNPASPTVVYAGNPQGRDFGECGSRGCYLVEIDQDRQVKTKFVPVNSIQFEVINLTLDTNDNWQSIKPAIEKALEEIPYHSNQVKYLLRVELNGRTQLHADLQRKDALPELREALNESTIYQVDRVTAHTLPDIDLEKISQGDSFPAEILRNFSRIENDEDARRQLFETVESEFAATIRDLDRDLDEESKQLILQKAKMMLLNQLLT